MPQSFENMISQGNEYLPATTAKKQSNASANTSANTKHFTSNKNSAIKQSPMKQTPVKA